MTVGALAGAFAIARLVAQEPRCSGRTIGWTVAILVSAALVVLGAGLLAVEAAMD
jgi:hypothetical protein